MWPGVFVALTFLSVGTATAPWGLFVVALLAIALWKSS